MLSWRLCISESGLHIRSSRMCMWRSWAWRSTRLGRLSSTRDHSFLVTIMNYNLLWTLSTGLPQMGQSSFQAILVDIKLQVPYLFIWPVFSNLHEDVRRKASTQAQGQLMTGSFRRWERFSIYWTVTQYTLWLNERNHVLSTAPGSLVKPQSRPISSFLTHMTVLSSTGGPRQMGFPSVGALWHALLQRWWRKPSVESGWINGKWDGTRAPDQVVRRISDIFLSVPKVIILAAPGDWNRFTNADDIHRWEWELSLQSGKIKIPYLWRSLALTDHCKTRRSGSCGMGSLRRHRHCPKSSWRRTYESTAAV